MELEDRKAALLGWLKENEDEEAVIDDIEEGYRDEVLKWYDREYFVGDDDEAQEATKQSIRDLIDDIGIESFSESYQEYICNNFVDADWFKEAYDESTRFYFQDIQSEDDDEFGNRAVRELYEAGLVGDDDFNYDEDLDEYDHSAPLFDAADYEDEYAEWAVDREDPIDWFKNNFGNEEFSRTVVEKNLWDEESVIEDVIDTDGRGPTLASYDGAENEYSYNGDLVYIYRMN